MLSQDNLGSLDRVIRIVSVQAMDWTTGES